MANVKEKLKSSAGESIAEVLIALLISSLALMMLAGMINAASNTITTSRKILEDYYGDDGEVSSGTATITFAGGLSVQPSIQIYKENLGNTEVTYYIPAGGATP